ncbi:MAG: GNAT family N-acetyltransferase [Candidatus Marinimicrobia bacterium]|nr:GNAT family N-acetyltransferase [Candidatus Neomarinimicrobiota bacterium]
MSGKPALNIKLIQNKFDMESARSIRETVFVIEQKVPPEIEYDEFEVCSTHILARLAGAAVGTARWRETEEGYKLERFAVLETFRGQGVGAAMVAFILNKIDPQAYIYLNSQVSAISFYSRLGFKAQGEIFYEAAIPHRKMVYSPPST